jgi:hypothetical protein
MHRPHEGRQISATMAHHRHPQRGPGRGRSGTGAESGRHERRDRLMPYPSPRAFSAIPARRHRADEHLLMKRSSFLLGAPPGKTVMFSLRHGESIHAVRSDGGNDTGLGGLRERDLDSRPRCQPQPDPCTAKGSMYLDDQSQRRRWRGWPLRYGFQQLHAGKRMVARRSKVPALRGFAAVAADV